MSEKEIERITKSAEECVKGACDIMSGAATLAADTAETVIKEGAKVTSGLVSGAATAIDGVFKTLNDLFRDKE